MLAALTYCPSSAVKCAFAEEDLDMVMSTKPSDQALPRTTGRWRLVRRLSVVGIAAAVAGCKGEAAVEREVVRPVKVAIVAQASNGRTLTYSGVVRPRVESALGFRVGGKIVERAVNVGDRVEVGQLIARLDATDLKLAENSA